LFLILIYCFGGMSEVNLAKYDSGFIGGGDDFMIFYPLAAWFYVGVEAMTLTCEDIKDAGKQVPWAIMGCVATLFCTFIMIYFVICSLAPGSLLVGEATFPLDAPFL
jgi:amino acid permease